MIPTPQLQIASFHIPPYCPVCVDNETFAFLPGREHIRLVYILATHAVVYPNAFRSLLGLKQVHMSGPSYRPMEIFEFGDNPVFNYLL